MSLSTGRNDRIVASLFGILTLASGCASGDDSSNDTEALNTPDRIGGQVAAPPQPPAGNGGTAGMGDAPENAAGQTTESTTGGAAGAKAGTAGSQGGDAGAAGAAGGEIGTNPAQAGAIADGGVPGVDIPWTCENMRTPEGPEICVETVEDEETWRRIANPETDFSGTTPATYIFLPWRGRVDIPNAYLNGYTWTFTREDTASVHTRFAATYLDLVPMATSWVRPSIRLGCSGTTRPRATTGCSTRATSSSSKMTTTVLSTPMTFTAPKTCHVTSSKSSTSKSATHSSFDRCSGKAASA